MVKFVCLIKILCFRMFVIHSSFLFKQKSPRLSFFLSFLPFPILITKSFLVAPRQPGSFPLSVTLTSHALESASIICLLPKLSLFSPGRVSHNVTTEYGLWPCVSRLNLCCNLSDLTHRVSCVCVSHQPQGFAATSLLPTLTPPSPRL